MTYRHIEVEPISGALGAEVRGIDLRSAAADAFDEVRAALNRHLVVFFRGQTLSPEEQLDLTRRFGRIGKVPHASRLLAGYDDILETRNKAHANRSRNVGGSWHTDMPFLERPPDRDWIIEEGSFQNYERGILARGFWPPHSGRSPATTVRYMLRAAPQSSSM